MSVIASLTPERRAGVLAELAALLERHGVREVEVPQVARLWVSRRA
jgi:hypothetical protein